MNKNVRQARHDEVQPLINADSETLVLGSMLSPKSAQAKFYYAHPQNRFWRVIARVFDAELPTSFEECAKLALSNNLALWDVISSCEIVGAADSTITSVEYNDVAGLLDRYKNITRIFTTGGKAHELLMKYNKEHNNPVIATATRLPSTSPLNCAASLDALVDAYSILKN